MGQKKELALLTRVHEHREMALVFQYGSNCLTGEINSEGRLKGDAKFFEIAETVEDYELAFQVNSVRRRCAASNIIRKPGSKVWGVLWEIPDALLSRGTSGTRKSLDAIEGEGTNYIRTAIEVRLASGNIQRVQTYIAKNPQAGLRTNLAYVSLIVAGLREHPIPKDYVDRVKNIAGANNPLIAPEISAL